MSSDQSERGRLTVSYWVQKSRSCGTTTTALLLRAPSDWFIVISVSALIGAVYIYAN